MRRRQSCSTCCIDGDARRAGAGARGFTLLEIVVAVTIFGLLTIAVYSTFRTGLRSYESGREQMTVTQTARVVFDLLGRELRAIYYQSPTQYNRNVIRYLQMRSINQLSPDPKKIAQDDRARRTPPKPGEEDQSEDEEQLPGIPISLTIVGKNAGDFDSITFVCYQVDWGTGRTQPWSLARVKYFVEDGNLFRSEGSVAVEKVPSYQWQAPLSIEDIRRGNRAAPEDATDAKDPEVYLTDAPRELVARNVTRFDLSYGYWTVEGWFESPDWIAHERRYRNKVEEIDPLAPNADVLRAFQQALPSDDIPAYVTLTLGIGKPNAKEKTRVFRSRVRLLSSLETYRPFVDWGLVMGSQGASGATTPYGINVPRQPIRR